MNKLLNKLLLIILLSIIALLFSCSPFGKTVLSNTAKETPKGNTVGLNAKEFYKIRIEDLNDKNSGTDQFKEYTNTQIVNEFLSFLKNQKYTQTDEKSDMYYKLEFIDGEGKPVMKASFGSLLVNFDRDAVLDGSTFKKGTYKVENFLDPYIKAFYEGKVLDPQFIGERAKLKIPDESFSLQIVDKGSRKVNLYDVYTKLYDFADKNFQYRDFEIVESKRYYDHKSIEEEISKTESDESCIELQAGSSETFIEIESTSEYKESSSCYNIVLSKSEKGKDIYKLITDNMIFYLRVKFDFDSMFQAVFSTNQSASKTVTPEEIKKLFDEKKPYFMEYISKNLDIDDFTGRTPESLSIKQMKLDSKAEPYTVVSVSNPFNVRLLFFNKNSGNNYQFIDYIDFGGHAAGTDYKLEKIGDKIFITGNICTGYGTGLSTYCKEWFTVSDEGKKLVFSFPYYDYVSELWGGHTSHGDIKINRNKKISISVKYSVTKTYLIDLDIANKDGFVEIPLNKDIEFKWDDTEKVFKSEYSVDETGVIDIHHNGMGLAVKCDGILKKYHDKLLENINSIQKEQNEFTRDAKISGIKTFLDDCTDSERKTELERNIGSISSK